MKQATRPNLPWTNPVPNAVIYSKSFSIINSCHNHWERVKHIRSDSVTHKLLPFWCLKTTSNTGYKVKTPTRLHSLSMSFLLDAAHPSLVLSSQRQKSCPFKNYLHRLTGTLRSSMSYKTSENNWKIGLMNSDSYRNVCSIGSKIKTHLRWTTLTSYYQRATTRSWRSQQSLRIWESNAIRRLVICQMR